MIIQEIEIEKIKIPEVRASSEMTEEQKQILEASIKQYGIVQPVIVRELGSGLYELVAGKNRLDQVIKSGAKKIQALILPLSEKDSIVLHLAENLARGKVNDMAIAKVLKRALDKGVSIKELSSLLNRSEEWVKDRLLLLELPEVYQDAIATEKLSIGHIKQALRLDTPEEIENALSTALNLGWSVSILKTYVDNRIAQKEALELAKREGVTPPSFVELKPELLASVEQCFICNNFVERKKITLPRICEDCRRISEYVVRQIGNDMKAMQKIYQAITMYDTYMKAQEIKANLEIVKKSEEAQSSIEDVQ